MFDPKCYEIAEYFLGKAPQHLKDELAQHIQDEIEGWLTSEVETSSIGAPAS